MESGAWADDGPGRAEETDRAPTGRTAACRLLAGWHVDGWTGSLTGMWAGCCGPDVSVRVVVERTCGWRRDGRARSVGLVDSLERWGRADLLRVGPACQSRFLHSGSMSMAIVLCSVQSSIFSTRPRKRNTSETNFMFSAP